MKIKSLFISKSLEEVPELTNFCTKNSIKLIGQSFLKFVAIPFQLNESFQIIFFASPRAVKFFLAQATIPTTAQIACAGKSTKSILENLGYTVNFTPIESGNVTKSAKEFAKWCTNRTVLFPVSTISNKSYTQFLKKSQVVQVVVYSTEIEGHIVEGADYYVFTSPSNVKGFFDQNHLSANTKVIAFGESTTKELKKNSVQNIHMLKESSEFSVIEHIRLH